MTDPWELIERVSNEGRNFDPSLDDDAAHMLEGFALHLLAMRAKALPAADSPAMAPMHGARTTQAMRQAALPRSGSLRAAMVQLLLHHEGSGYTDDELEVTLGRSHQSVSAARYTLVQQGWVHAMLHHGTPVERPTRAGNPAQVWALSPAGRLRLALGQ